MAWKQQQMNEYILLEIMRCGVAWLLMSVNKALDDDEYIANPYDRGVDLTSWQIWKFYPGSQLQKA